MLLRKLYDTERIFKYDTPTTGQAIGAAVGLAAGFFIGPIGPVLGFTIGLGIGTFIDPPKIEEPDASPFSVQDLQFNTFRRNLPVPVVYGVNRVGGNIIWIGNTRTEIRELPATGGGGGGKGFGSTPDPPTVTEQIFHADFAMALSEGQIDGVLATFIDEKNIQDIEGLNWINYLGTASENPDPRVITALGSDAPAFRHTAYTVFFGEIGQINRIPLMNQVIVGILGGPISSFQTVFEDTLNNNVKFLVHCEGETYLGHSDFTAKVYRTTSGVTASWSIAANFGNWGIQDAPLAVHSGIPGRVYAQRLGVSGTIQGSGGIIRSDDCFATLGCEADLPGDTGNVQAILGIQDNSSEVLVTTHKRFAPFTQALSGGLFRSTDGGCTFVPGDPLVGGEVFFRGMFQFPGTDVVLIGGSPFGKVFRSTDRGQTFSVVETGSLLAGIHRGVALDADVGVFAAGAGRIIVTQSRGLEGSWTIHSFGILEGGSNIEDVKAHAGNLYVVGGPGSPQLGVVQVSSDKGVTWTKVWSDAPHRHSLLVTDEDICVGGGTPAAISCFRATIAGSCANPANVINDYLTNPRYGLGIPDDRIHGGSFSASRAYCAEQIPLADGGTEQRFCLDTVLDVQKPVPDHLRDMLATFRGFLAWSQGTVKLLIERETLVTQSFGMAEIVADSFTWKRQSYRDRPNIVKVEYIEPGQGANENSYRLEFVEAFDDWDIDRSGERRERTFRLLGIKRKTQAQRMATFYLDKAIHIRNAAELRVGVAALQSEVGDVISITHDVPAWAGKEMRIMEIGEAPNDELQLSLLEYNEAIFTDEVKDTSVRSGQDIIGDPPLDLSAVPWQVGRLTAHQRLIDETIELSFTRLASHDLLSNANFFVQRNGGEFEAIGAGIPLGPTAFVDPDVRSVTAIQTGDPIVAGGGNSAYVDVIKTTSPQGYWRFGDVLGTNTLTDEMFDSHMPHQNSTSFHTEIETPLIVADGTDAGSVSAFLNITGVIGEHGFFSYDRVATNQNSFRTPQFSVEGWIMSNCFAAFPFDKFIITNGGNPGQVGRWAAAFTGAGGDRGVFAAMLRTDSGNVTMNTSVSPADDTVYYWAMTYDETILKMFIYDKVTTNLTLTTQSWGGPIDITSKDITIGGRKSGASRSNNLGAFQDEVAFYPFALTNSQVHEHFLVGIGSGFPGPPTGGGSGSIAVTGLPDGWSTQLFHPNSTSLATGIGTLGTAIMSPAFIPDTASGFLLVYTDGPSFTSIAKGGRFPETGDADFRDGDVYEYDRLREFITATQTFIPIFNPKGGFANIGSARIFQEQMGYDTFTDCRLEGVTRGSAGTTATSHSNILSLRAVVQQSLGGLMDVTTFFTNPGSPHIDYFSNNSEFLYLGASSKFSRVEVWQVLNASDIVSLAFEYSTGDGEWASSATSGLLPVCDLTSGLLQSGVWLVEPPGDWSPTNATLPGSADLSDASSLFYLRALRASPTLATPPQELEFFLSGETIAAVRKANAFFFQPTAQDSGLVLTFKAIAVGVKGQEADGTKAPIFTLTEGV